MQDHLVTYPFFTLFRFRPAGTLAIWAALLLGAVVASGGQAPLTASAPASAPTPTPQERLNDLVALIEGPTAPEVRRAVTRELLLQRWPQTPPRLAAVLAGSNMTARIAIATALTELPQFLEPVYIDSLMAMLGDGEADVRAAAASALAAYRDGGVVDRLRQKVRDRDQPQLARLGAIAALGRMTRREAIEGLSEALSDPDAAIAAAALAAFEQATAIDFGGDPAAARRWWDETGGVPLETWQSLQIERLAQRARDLQARLEATEARLNKGLEAGFLRATDAERIALLTTYLADSMPTIRLLGLRLVQLHLAEGKAVDTLPTELALRIRELTKSTDPRERAAAVRAVAALRDPADAAPFLAMLANTQNRAVRLALINGLGYVGDGAATRALLDVLAAADDEVATEVVAALGRLAERNAIDPATRPAVVATLRKVFERATPARVALRERVLWAMGNVPDPSFGAAFAAALGAAEAVAVRQAAARGIAALNDPQLAEALAAATSDPDPGVRKTAVETLARLGSTERDLQALWARVSSPPETDEAIRQAAWRGVLALVPRRSPVELESWLARVTSDTLPQRQRVIELLQRVVKSLQEVEPVDRARVGTVRARLAAEYALSDQFPDAVSEYLAALTDLRAAGSAAERRVALELLRAALRGGRYDEAIAAALAAGNPGPDGTALWEVAAAEIEVILAPESAGRAVQLLDALTAYPPGEWPPAVRESLRQLRARAAELRPPASTTDTAPPPSSAPASQPGA